MKYYSYCYDFNYTTLAESEKNLINIRAYAAKWLTAGMRRRKVLRQAIIQALFPALFGDANRQRIQEPDFPYDA